MTREKYFKHKNRIIKIENKNPKKYFTSSFNFTKRECFDLRSGHPLEVRSVIRGTPYPVAEGGPGGLDRGGFWGSKKGQKTPKNGVFGGSKIGGKKPEKNTFFGLF